MGRDVDARSTLLVGAERGVVPSTLPARVERGAESLTNVLCAKCRCSRGVEPNLFGQHAPPMGPLFKYCELSVFKAINSYNMASLIFIPDSSPRALRQIVESPKGSTG